MSAGADFDRALDAILRADGLRLADFTPSARHGMREALRKILLATYVAVIHAERGATQLKEPA